MLIILIFISILYITYNCTFNIKLKLHLPIMVEQASKEEATSSDTHGGESGDKKGLHGQKAFKKKYSKGSYVDKKSEGISELLKGVSFSISSNGPDI